MHDLIVIGLGYVGLPLVREADRAGMRVTGYDYSQDVTAGLNAGRSHVDDITARHTGRRAHGGALAPATAPPSAHRPAGAQHTISQLEQLIAPGGQAGAEVQPEP